MNLKKGIVTDNQKWKVSQGLWDHIENRKKRLTGTVNNRQFCKKLRTQQHVRKNTTWCSVWWSLWYWVSLTLPGWVSGKSLQEIYRGELHGSPLYFRWIFQITLWREHLKEKTTGRKSSLESLHQSLQEGRRTRCRVVAVGMEKRKQLKKCWPENLGVQTHELRSIKWTSERIRWGGGRK